jgi:ribosomal protein L9
MELLDIFVPHSMEFAREPMRQEKESNEGRYGASDAADIFSAATMSPKPKHAANGIYGSVSTANIVAAIKAALGHNDEAARVLLSESHVKFITGTEEDDASRVKQLGAFKVEIMVPGAAQAITRTINIRAKKGSELAL